MSHSAFHSHSSTSATQLGGGVCTLRGGVGGGIYNHGKRIEYVMLYIALPYMVVVPLSLCKVTLQLLLHS